MSPPKVLLHMEIMLDVYFEVWLGGVISASEWSWFLSNKSAGLSLCLLMSKICIIFVTEYLLLKSSCLPIWLYSDWSKLSRTLVVRYIYLYRERIYQWEAKAVHQSPRKDDCVVPFWYENLKLSLWIINKKFIVLFQWCARKTQKDDKSLLVTGAYIIYLSPTIQ